MKLRKVTRFHKTDSHMCALHWPVLPKHGEDPWYSITFFTPQDEYVGYVLLFKTKYGFWETHSEITKRFRRNGCAVQMYNSVLSWALKKGMDIRSSANYSKAGERIWLSKRLRESYRITKNGKRYIPSID